MLAATTVPSSVASLSSAWRQFYLLVKHTWGGSSNNISVAQVVLVLVVTKSYTLTLITVMFKGCTRMKHAHYPEFLGRQPHHLLACVSLASAAWNTIQNNLFSVWLTEASGPQFSPFLIYISTDCEMRGPKQVWYRKVVLVAVWHKVQYSVRHVLSTTQEKKTLWALSSNRTSLIHHFPHGSCYGTIDSTSGWRKFYGF